MQAARRSWRCMLHFPPKHLLTFNGLHGFISHKIELFITIPVRTSRPSTDVRSWTGIFKTNLRVKAQLCCSCYLGSFCSYRYTQILLDPLKTHSLPAKWVLGLASTVILGAESCGTHDHILFSHTALGAFQSLNKQGNTYSCKNSRSKSVHTISVTYQIYFI
jgi:hypothetical protein